ncbi:MAG: hypothetical protein VW270_27195, partial [Candidatus Poseidoniales archaeon]
CGIMQFMEALIKFLRNQFRVGYFNVKLLNPKDVSDPIVGAIKSIPDTATIKNPDEISSGIIEAQKETTQAVKDITFPEQKELDLKPLYEKFDELKTAIDKKELSVTVGETKIDVDTKGIISSVERLQQAVEGSKETIEPQEVIDYTELLGEVIKNLEKPGYDYSKIEELLGVISKKEVVLPLDEKGRVKVSVDKVSMGGRGSLSSTESAKLLTLATEEKQDSLLLVKNPGQTLYDKDSTGLLYKGYNASPDAAQSATDWLIIKYVKTSGSLVQKITRTGSWTGRVALF